MVRFRTAAIIFAGLFILVVGWRYVPSTTTFAQPGQTLMPSPIVIDFVSTAEDDPNGVTTVQLFDGGIGETDLSDLILLVVDEREDPSAVTAVSLQGFLTDEDGYFTIGGPEDTPKAEAQPFHMNAPLGATHVGLLSAAAEERIDTDILSKELLSDLVILGNDSIEARSLALSAGTQPLAVVAPSSASTRGGGTATLPPPCSAEATFIHAVQGSGAFSPLRGEIVTVEGIVVADFQDTQTGMGGFNLQEELADQDADPTTSEGIFVFDNGFGVDIAVGDKVRVTGEVAEFFSLTELKNLTDVTICESGLSVDPTPLMLPEGVDGELEQLEGMLVEIKHEMTVAQNFFLGRYGQLTLSAHGRAFQPTNLFPPNSPEAEALADENARRLLILDDGQDVRSLGDNPVPVPYLGIAPPRVLRAGDTVTNLVGVIDFGRINSAPEPDTGRDYRLHPVSEPIFTAVNLRPEAPMNVDGTLRVASFNVLNYFNGNGDGSGFPTSRGARNFADFQRQQAKIVSAILAMDADIIGLMEIENDGYGPNSAIQDLLKTVNVMAPDGVEYAAVDPDLDELGSDEIAVGFIYRTDTVSLVGEAVTLDTGAFDQTLPSGRSRQPLAQTFADANGEMVTLAVNHFKSKRPSDNPTGGNADLGPGLGAWNERRTEAAQDLVDWLATDPTGSGDSDILIIGDLNAYGQETPITTIVEAGYVNLLAKSTDMNSYSFIFDGQAGYLDHALASQSLIQQVRGSSVWHINTDEPKVIDYDSRFNPPGYYSSDPYRSSDHDPVIVGLELASSDTGEPTPMIPTPLVTSTVESPEAYPTVAFPTVAMTPTIEAIVVMTPVMEATATWTPVDGTTTLLPTSTTEATTVMTPTVEATVEATVVMTPVMEATATWTPVDGTTTLLPTSTTEATTVMTPTVEATVVMTPVMEATATWTPVDGTTTLLPTSTTVMTPTVEATVVMTPVMEATATWTPVDGTTTLLPTSTTEATTVMTPTVEATVVMTPVMEATATWTPVDGTTTLLPTSTTEATTVMTPTVEATMEATVVMTPTEVTIVITDTPGLEPTATWTPLGEATETPMVDATLVYTPVLEATATWTPPASTTVEPTVEPTPTATPQATNPGTTTLLPTPTATAQPTVVDIPTTAPDATAEPAVPTEITQPVPSTVVPTATTPSIAAPAISTFTHVVVRGEHLSLIARRYSVTIAALAKANNLSIHAALRVGHQLIIPSIDRNVECVRYLTAGAGDSVETLVSDLDVLPESLASFNGLSATAILSEGQQICLPDIYSDGYYGRSPAYGHYTVRYGETLSHVAARFGCPVSHLRKLNGLWSPHRIYAGQKLIVPR